MKSSLADKQCIPCKGGTPPLLGEKLKALHDELGYSWNLVDEHHLEKEFKFKNFKEALEFTNKVGALAEEVNHHPDIYLSWGKVKITQWTHKIGGLSEADFVFAAKVDRLISPASA
jgi:4a-hydroxytetrahydrobiopterin dehydratase